MRQRLAEQLRANAYPGYVYGYPHKKAYRPLPPRPLRDVWAAEDRRALYCYVHVPFCNQRCSFCNLFTYVPGGELPTAAYLDALAREMEAYAAVLRPMRFARLYVGGGTPTFLSVDELRRLVRMLRDTLGVDPAQTHGCIEASPETLDEEKVAALRELGFRRLSLGVQSFVAEELRQVNRRDDFACHGRVFRMIGDAKFPHFNVDLIYGLPGQTQQSWRASLAAAVDTPATSLFLYPLYVRPLTGLDRRTPSPLPLSPQGGEGLGVRGLPCPTPHEMGAMYDFAVERLAAAGFRQLTMRQFRRDPLPQDADEYRCQRDGMVGLGAGARSYTRQLHYSTPWRMVARNIRGVVDDYCRRMRVGDTAVSHGFLLDADEQARRHVIQSLLYDGQSWADFAAAFGGADARVRFRPQWEALAAEACVALTDGGARLTARGVRHADVVGDLFFSARVRRLLDTYEYDT
jgi:oxygen-independent coproporphyrinogen-3 oxidase